MAAKRIDDDAGIKAGGDSENRFCRYMFLEFIVRIADQKYRRPKIVERFSEAVQKLMDHFNTHFNVAKLFPW